MAAFSAKNAKVRIGATTFTATKWTVNVKVDELDVTNFEGAGYGDWIGGVVDAEITVDGWWDATQDPHTNPPNIQSGQILSSVKLYLNDTSGVFWNFPSILVGPVTVDAAVRDYVKISFTAKSKGTFSYP